MGKRSQKMMKVFKMRQNGWSGKFYCEKCGNAIEFEQVYIQVPLCLCEQCGKPWLDWQMGWRVYHPLTGKRLIESSELDHDS